MVTSYVVGLAFSSNRRDVLLIEKTHPKWQKGKLNGVGGHIENGESPAQAMVREFQEETALCVPELLWLPVVKVSDMFKNIWEVYFFATVASIEYACTTTEEQLHIVSPNKLHELNCIDNLKWIIPMALSCDRKEMFSL